MSSHTLCGYQVISALNSSKSEIYSWNYHYFYKVSKWTFISHDSFPYPTLWQPVVAVMLTSSDYRKKNKSAVHEYIPGPFCVWNGKINDKHNTKKQKLMRIDRKKGKSYHQQRKLLIRIQCETEQFKHG